MSPPPMPAYVPDAPMTWPEAFVCTAAIVCAAFLAWRLMRGMFGVAP